MRGEGGRFWVKGELITYGTRLLFLLKQSLKTILSWFNLRRSLRRGATQIVQTPDFNVLQNDKHPCAAVSGEDLRRGERGGVTEPRCRSPRGAALPLAVSEVIFLCWREKNTTVPREKQATVKLVISTVTITRRKATSYPRLWSREVGFPAEAVGHVSVGSGAKMSTRFFWNPRTVHSLVLRVLSQE